MLDTTSGWHYLEKGINLVFHNSFKQEFVFIESLLTRVSMLINANIRQVYNQGGSITQGKEGWDREKQNQTK